MNEKFQAAFTDELEKIGGVFDAKGAKKIKNMSVTEDPSGGWRVVFEMQDGTTREIKRAQNLVSGARPCPGSKIRSEGAGRGLGRGKGMGPIGIPFGKK